MKHFILALVFSLTTTVSYGAVECFDDGVKIYKPNYSQWIAVPVGYNTAPCDAFYNPKGKGCWPETPDEGECLEDPYAAGCSQACNGPTPGGRCRVFDLLYPRCVANSALPACYQLPDYYVLPDKTKSARQLTLGGSE